MGCRPEHYERQTLDVNGYGVRLLIDARRPPTPAVRAAILRSLEIIPPPHLRLFGDYGYVCLCKPGCPPDRGGGNNPSIPYVRLSNRCLGEGYNRNYNITLLHEFGHIVDTRFDAMNWLQANRPDDFRILAQTGHEGATDFAGERFADCYMLYLMNEIAGERTRHPADPRAYLGEEARRRYAILLSTPAFRGATRRTEPPAPIDSRCTP